MKYLVEKQWKSRNRNEYDWTNCRRLGLAIAFALIFLRLQNLLGIGSSTHDAEPRSTISISEFKAGRLRCIADQQRPEVDYNFATARLGRLQQQACDGKRSVWKNATLIDGDGKVSKSVNIFLCGGLIQKVQPVSSSEDFVGSEIVEVEGRFVTPGLVEIHSHVGVREIPQLWANEDVTELSAPITPWARAIDGYKAYDVGVDLVASGGVTTSLVLTGAQSIISGEGYVFKMKRGDSPYATLVNSSADIGGKPQRYLKMALGENIKLTFENRGGPTTREGISFYLRRALEQAENLRRRQDSWCNAFGNDDTQSLPSSSYPTSLELQTLVDLLRGDIRLNVHCYETEDVYSLFSHSDEFGFNVSAIHHALASHLMISELKKRDVTVATFSNEWGFKKELYDTSFYLPKALADAGIPLALTTDHPAEYGKLLMYEAQVVHHYGVNEELAIASLISVPAQSLGLDNRLGYVRPGYDADLVVWDRHPLRQAASALLVIIEGEVVVNASDRLWAKEQPVASTSPPSSRSQQVANSSTCFPGQKNVVVQGIVVDLVHTENSDMHFVDGFPELATAVIRNGKLDCVGRVQCRLLGESLIANENFPTLNVTNGHILPGLTMVTRQYGMGEMPYEASSMDGKNNGDEIQSPSFAKDALRFGEGHMDHAHRGGVTRLITPPMTDGFFHGISAAFRTGASSVLDVEAISVADCALHFTIGHPGKQLSIPAVSRQLLLLREILTTRQAMHPLYEKAAKGNFPVVIHTDNKDIIAQIIKLKQDTGVDFIIMGGAEAHLLASSLAAIKIPVILAPGICHPFTWDERRCLVGPPLTDYSNADVLSDAGVLLAIGNWDYRQRHVEDALWEASWTLDGIDRRRRALDMVSKNVERMFGIVTDEQSSVVVHEGDPFEFGSNIALILEAGAIQRCWPAVEPPRGF